MMMLSADCQDCRRTSKEKRCPTCGGSTGCSRCGLATLTFAVGRRPVELWSERVGGGCSHVMNNVETWDVGVLMCDVVSSGCCGKVCEWVWCVERCDRW